MNPTRRPIRVLMVAQPLDAGVPRHVLDIVDELGGSDAFALTVACPPSSMMWDRLARTGAVRLRRFTARRAPHPSDLLWIVRLLPMVWRSDVVHAHSSKAAWLSRATAMLLGRRSSCVVTPHAWSFWAFTGPRRRALVMLERLAARACAVIVAVSEHEREEGLRLCVGRSAQYRVIRNGVDLERWQAARVPDRDLVLMVGRLAPQKRPELAIRALAVARRQKPSLRLALAGSGELEPGSRLLADRLGLCDSVEFLGNRDDVPELLSRAGCVVVTSVYEGCSLAILEAMAAGVPVVAARFGGVDELVDDGVTGLLCDDTPEQLGAALVRLRDDDAMADRLGKEARRRARDVHSRSRMAAELAAVYLSLARSRPHAGD
jgi:glycosyltransferase involved in cell wall biosynthesis